MFRVGVENDLCKKVREMEGGRGERKEGAEGSYIHFRKRLRQSSSVSTAVLFPPHAWTRHFAIRTRRLARLDTSEVEAIGPLSKKCDTYDLILHIRANGPRTTNRKRNWSIGYGLQGGRSLFG